MQHLKVAATMSRLQRVHGEMELNRLFFFGCEIQFFMIHISQTFFDHLSRHKHGNYFITILNSGNIDLFHQSRAFGTFSLLHCHLCLGVRASHEVRVVQPKRPKTRVRVGYFVPLGMAASHMGVPGLKYWLHFPV